jgi:uncharacterized protein
MTRRAGSADLPLHGGRVPRWLADRMTRMGAVVCEAIVLEYGRDELLRRLSHPFWFQSFGAVMGMDWHSSGITTSVIGALKRGLTPLSRELGIHVCGGRGKHSRATPGELLAIGERVGFDGAALAQASRLVAKVDSAAVQDGFDLYLHGFIVSDDGQWVVVQQGMNGASKQARRYHWLSEGLEDFLEDPHAAVEGPGQGVIVNLADRRAAKSRAAQVGMLAELAPEAIAREFAKIECSRTAHTVAPGTPVRDATGARECREARAGMSGHQANIVERPPGHTGTRPAGTHGVSEPSLATGTQLSLLPHLSMPDHHDVRAENVVVRRLHGALAAAADRGPKDFAELLQVPGVGARTVRALAMVAEVVHGTPCRFSDPARFSLALGGKDRHPFPVPTKVYDHTIGVLKSAVRNAKLGREEELQAIRRLDAQARALERTATGPSVDAYIAEERRRSHEYGGRSIFGWEPAMDAVEAAARKAG